MSLFNNGGFIANCPEKDMRFITFRNAIGGSFISVIFAIRENEKYTQSEYKKEKKNARLNVTEHLWRVCYIRCKKGTIPEASTELTTNTVSPIEIDRPW